MLCRLAPPVAPGRRRSKTFPLVASIVIFCTGVLALPMALALAEGADPSATDWPIEVIPPAQRITHEKGSLHWTNKKPESGFTVKALSGTESLWGHTEEEYWDQSFKVVGDKAKGILPKFTAYFNDVLEWVNPETGATEPLDFQCEFEALDTLGYESDPEVRMLYANGFYTVNIKHAQVKYRFFDSQHKETAINPGLFVYWCRSLNPGEGVGFSREANPGLNLKAAYLTDDSLYGQSYVNRNSLDRWAWEKNPSIRVDQGDDLLKFTGANYLTCTNGVQVDVADSTEAFLRGCTEHTFVPVEGGFDDRPDYVVHGDRIPYDKYIQYRAVTFEMDPCEDPNVGLTLDYFSETEDYYWEMEFNGIMVTRHLPTKTLVSDDDELPLPGDEVTFDVTQSLADIPSGLVTELVFEDELDDRLELSSAAMLVGGEDVTTKAGSFERSGNKLTYRFNDEGLKLLKYGPDASTCTLRITAMVGGTVDYGDEIPNRAKVTMNSDVAETPEAVVKIGPEPKPDVSVETGKGELLISKTVGTPNNSGVARVGDPLTYLITVRNHSGSTMTNVHIEDSLPYGITLTSKPFLSDNDRVPLQQGSCEYWVGDMTPDGGIDLMAASGGSGSGGSGPAGDMPAGSVWSGKIEATVPSLAVGKKVHIEFTAAVAAYAPPTVTNKARAWADGYDKVSATASFEVERPNPDDDPQNPGGNQGGGESQGGGGSGGSGSGGSGTGGSGSGGSGSGGTGGSGSGGSGSGSGDPSGSDPNNPSDADGPGTGDQDNSGGSGADQPGGTGGTGGGGGASGGGGTGTGTSGAGGGGTGGTGGGTGTGGTPVGYPPPVPDYAGTANAPATMAADASQGDGKPKGGKRLLPQTDAPPVIGIATTGGIGMTGALVAHSIWNNRNRRR